MLERMLPLVFLSIILTLFVPAPSHYAQAAPSSGGSNVSVGVWLINVGKVDLSAGTADLDFYVWFNSSASPQNVSFEFMNGVVSSTSLISSSPSYQEYRVRGTFQNNLDFKNFPFDSHVVTIEIEDKNLSSSNLNFVPDSNETGVDPSINIAGWTIQNSSANVVQHSYPGNETYSRFIFGFDIGRSILSSVVKSVVPISIITTIAMLAFFVPPADYAQRIGLGVTALLAAVASHLALVSQIPPVGYLTLADKIMVTAYGLFLYGIAVSVLVMRRVHKNKMEEAERLNSWSRLALPGVILILIVPLLVLT